MWDMPRERERERETESIVADCRFMRDSIIVNEGGERGRDGTRPR